ncbi:hypothetical protein HRR80_002498 [Exophiala dermatitidis]|uniref:Uncharacterized protein n=1 Tax=Exophiala dermatitidis TaxID=5970 RepID=A0AAN6F0D4_EXODE|nr:hypothetical protein HRR77_004147 [Exophiala dermatitidis]KAJ4575566.1 hypothetical protein HRR79_002480 [Exophiala dermatitidis]KAJ4587364.1 hypothetical protein HRR82_001177 [Exophiala dermatitidis]KAJ4613887.1 hypothetical protein HRR85_004173 [Exophiala dermatitidis]KAJ8993999.1 hypothetical protein HRR80_002498 [Exophiala dermatitidis]
MDITSSIYLAVAFIVLLFYLRLILFSRNIANQESSTSVLRCVDRPRANQDQHQLATHVQRTNQPASAALCMKYSSCFFCVVYEIRRSGAVLQAEPGMGIPAYPLQRGSHKLSEMETAIGK